MQREGAAAHAPWPSYPLRPADAPSSTSAPAPAPAGPAVRLALPSEGELAHDGLAHDSWRGAAREVRRAAISPLYLPYISPVSPLHLPCISPLSPQYLPEVRRACAAAMAPLAEVDPASRTEPWPYRQPEF